MKILAINGAYREGGITDQTLRVMTDTLLAGGADVETIVLRDIPLKFCLNCRECTQAPGQQPGRCVQQDGMQSIIEKIESADGLIIASTTNLITVTAIYKRFMERLVVYAYWPWGAHAPRIRKSKRQTGKQAVLVTSSAAPGWLGRLCFSTVKQLRMTANTVGANTLGVCNSGLVSRDPDHKISLHTRELAVRLAGKLLRSH